MSKYAIDKEFFPYSLFAPPIRNAKMAGWMGSLMRPPKWIWRDSEVTVSRERIAGYEGAEIELLIFAPKDMQKDAPRGCDAKAPCLVYYHGGGFFFEGAGYHYQLAKAYALGAMCKVIFVQYRLAPKHPFPIPVEDSYAALRWTFEHAEELSIDASRVAVGGDSAGGNLAAAVCQMARDRGTNLPLFQLLIYPATDRRMATESNRKFTDTPMWNSSLSKKMWPGYLAGAEVNAGTDGTPSIAYASPMEAETFDGLPDAYVETAEFDCLHDEGIAYGLALREAGATVEINETKGTMHGFDIVTKSSIAQAAVAERVRYMQRKFGE